MTNINLLLLLAFVVLTMLGFMLIKPQNRWVVLLVTCLIAYIVIIREKFIIMLGMALLVYLLGLLRQKKINIWPALILLLVPLITYKVTNYNPHFYQYSISQFSSLSFSWSGLFQIIGISYITFNAIGYLVDIKRGYVSAERNFFKLLLYLFYFPIVFSGPLHRYKYLKNQFEKMNISSESFTNGLRLILWGLFKNLVLGKRLYVLLSYLLASELSGVYFLMAGLVFFLYIYCNFSSFIDFFQGISEIFGIRLNNNFSNRIYLANSRQKFWSGWHITLNHWFRDYFFYAIIKYDKQQRFIDPILLITFILIALWHELSMPLLIWGSLNGIWIILEKKVNFKKWKHARLRQGLGVIYHLSISSLIALVFISPDFIEMFTRLTSSPVFPTETLRDQTANIVIILLCFIVMDVHYSRAKGSRFDEYVAGQSTVFRWLTYLKLGFLLLIFAENGGLDNYYVQF